MNLDNLEISKDDMLEYLKVLGYEIYSRNFEYWATDRFDEYYLSSIFTLTLATKDSHLIPKHSEAHEVTSEWRYIGESDFAKLNLPGDSYEEVFWKEFSKNLNKKYD